MAEFESILKNDKDLEKLSTYYYSTNYKGPINIPFPCEVALKQSAINVPACLAWDLSAATNTNRSEQDIIHASI